MLTVLNPDQWRVGLPDYYLIGLGNDAYDVQNASSGYSSKLSATYSLTSTNDTSIRFELRSGDHWWWDASSERTEISSREIVSYGTALDVSYKFTLEPGAANTAKWLVIGQLHQDYAPNEKPWSPPFSINLVGEKMAINIGFTDAAGNLVQKTLYVDAQNIVRGHEYDIDVKAVFDPSGNGRLVVTRDGVVIADYSGALGYSGHTGVYWKEGLYRAAAPETIAATYADLQISHGDMVQIPAAGAAAATPAAAPSLSVQTTSQNSDGTVKATISGTAPAGLTVNIYDGDHLIATTVANASGKYSLTLTGLGAGSHEISATYVQGGVLSRPSSGAVVEVGTAADILSRIDLVTAKDGLSAIILTDTHVFTVTSTSQISTLLTADKAALDKIVGGYSFQFFSGTSDNRTISYYDTTGTLVEAETKLYQGGVLTRDTLLHYGNATVVKEVYQYGITGKSYTSTYQAFDAAGNMLEIKRFHANGTLDYHSVVDAQGTTTSTSYNAAGVKTTDVITLKTGTVTSIAYDAAGIVTAISTTWTDKSSDYKIYTNGILASETIARAPAADGSQLTETYDGNGKLTTQKLALANGTSDTKSYTNGVLMQETIVYGSSSKSAVAKEIYKYHVTGKAYGTTHTTYDATGKQLAVEYLTPSEIVTSIGASLAAPTAITPTITAFSPDSSTAGDGLTNANHITLSGTAAAGSTVKIFDSSVQIGTVTANASGVWSYNSLALSDATHSFTAQSVNTAGDVSATSSSFKVTVDTTAPVLTLASSDASIVNNAVTGLNHVTLTGTGEAGRQVQVFDGAKQIGTALVDGTGSWSFATVTLTDGAHAFTVKETDAAGNVGTSAALNVTVDTLAPNAPVIGAAAVESNGSMDVSGTAEAGAIVRLYDGPKLLGTGTVAADGRWSINIGTPAVGAHAFSATATDAAGNLSHSSSTLNSVVGTIIEATGTTTLALAGGNYHLLDSGTDLLLQYSGAAVQAGQFGAATPIAAERTATGYDVAWKVAGSDQYFVWSTDSNGNFVANLTGTVSGSSSALKSLETVFHQDLNGDGVIGQSAPQVIAQASSFQGDGKTDLVFYNNDTHTAALWEPGGQAQGNPQVVSGAQGSNFAAKGDFNGDGQADLLFINDATHEVSELLTGAQTASSVTIGTINSAGGWHFADVVDFNGDGKSDLLFVNSVTNGVAVWQMDGSKVVANPQIGVMPQGFHIASTGDFNGDGKTDLLMINDSTHDASVWQMNGTQVASKATIGTINAAGGWNFVGAGDFNGDGKSDLLFLNGQTHGVAIWQMNGNQVTSSSQIAVMNAAGGWHFADVGDFNGDGKSDLLFLNDKTHGVAVWQMNGTSIVSGSVVGTVGADDNYIGLQTIDGTQKSAVYFENSVTHALTSLEITNNQAVAHQLGVINADAGWHFAI